ncbi:hypothetical protein DITRI_Ditri03aG0150400 [Diplodiscus trichospermus]
MAIDYCIRIRQENDNSLEQRYSSFPYDLFNIELSLNFETTLETFHRSVICARDSFLCREHGPIIIHSMFAETGLPLEFLESIIVPDILSFALQIDSDSINVGRKIIKLLFELQVEETVDEVDQAIDESLSTLNFKPASSSSIQSLKRIKWGDEDRLLPFKKRRRLNEGLSSKKECSICLDEFLEGEEVASMPCGHVYHDGCIVKWLETSHLCPLCRYQMPS